MEKGTLASDVLCLLTQEFGMLLTSEFAQGEASVTLLSLGMSPGKAALEKGVMVEKAQPGLGLASDVGKSKEMTSALRGPPPFHQPPPSSLLMWDGKAFPHKKSNYRISCTTVTSPRKLCWYAGGRTSASALPKHRGLRADSSCRAQAGTGPNQLRSMGLGFFSSQRRRLSRELK